MQVYNVAYKLDKIIFYYEAKSSANHLSYFFDRKGDEIFGNKLAFLNKKVSVKFVISQISE